MTRTDYVLNAWAYSLERSIPGSASGAMRLRPTYMMATSWRGEFAQRALGPDGGVPAHSYRSPCLTNKQYRGALLCSEFVDGRHRCLLKMKYGSREQE